MTNVRVVSKAGAVLVLLAILGVATTTYVRGSSANIAADPNAVPQEQREWVKLQLQVTREFEGSCDVYLGPTYDANKPSLVGVTIEGASIVGTITYLQIRIDSDRVLFVDQSRVLAIRVRVKALSK